MFIAQCECFRETLRNGEVEEYGRILVSNVVKELWNEIPVENKVRVRFRGNEDYIFLFLIKWIFQSFTKMLRLQTQEPLFPKQISL